jgi:integrase
MIYFHRDKGLVIPAVLYNVEKREEVPPRRGYYTAEEVEKVLRDCNPIQWLLIKIAFDSGMRLSELTNLRLREINDTQLNYTGKGNKQRESYISPITRERLDDYIQRNNITDYVFENPETGKPYGVNTIREKMRKAFIYAGFDGFYPHIMRHSFATDAQRNGASMIELRDMLGHKSVETTEVYLHGLEGHLHKIFDKYKFGIEPKKEQAKTETQASSFEGAIKQFIARLAEELSSAVK